VEELVSYWMDFHEILFGHFRKYVEKTKVLLNMIRKEDTFEENVCTIMIISPELFLA
jgi:hypothetical protein